MERNEVEINVGGRNIRVAADENRDYIKALAAYINERTDELKNQAGFARQTRDMQSILLSLNLADDYFKAGQKIKDLEKQIEDQSRELYQLKHELVELKMRNGKS
jgi:cell division protein ZapA